jgi:uncharacterized protein YecE (DUF72 family)
MGDQQPRAYVGTSAWNKPQWRGHFYPEGLVQRRELEYAAERLASLEINATFHGLQSPATYLDWRARTPDDFVFSVKGNRTVTHDHRLMNPARNVADFFASGVLGLQEKMGPVLWQVSEYLPFASHTTEEFLAVLPHSVGEAQALIEQHARTEADRLSLTAADRPIRHAFEVRHESFKDAKFLELLRRYDVAVVVTNSPPWPELRDVTSDFVYVRLHGDLERRPHGYSDADLDEWAGRINGWLSGKACPDGRGRDVFAYFDNPDDRGTRSPFDAMHLHDRLGTDTRPYRGDTTFQPPLWE